MLSKKNPNCQLKMPKSSLYSSSFMPKIGLCLLILSLYIGLFHSIHYPLFDVDEGAFSEASREMLVSGDFISPRLDQAPRFDKPILIYWLQSASLALFGINEFAARLPAALATCGWALLVWAFLFRVGHASKGPVAALILTTCMEISVLGKAATADTLLNLFLCAALFSWYLYLRHSSRKYLYLAFLFMSLGFLTKGPVAVVLPAGITFLYTLSSQQSIPLRTWLRAWLNPIGLLIFLLIAMPWYIAEYQRDGFDFVVGFFFKHNLGRFSQAMETHSGPWWYYLPVILIGLLPYSTALFSTLKDYRHYWNNDLFRFLIIWFLFVFLLFSISSTKLPHYIVYGYTPLFILIASTLSRCGRGSSTERLSNHMPALPAWVFIPAFASFIVLAFLPAILDHYLQQAKPQVLQAYGELPGLFTNGYVIVQSIFAGLVLFFSLNRKMRQVYGLIIIAIMQSWSLNHYILPAVSTIQQSPIKQAALLARQNGWDVHVWRIQSPSFSFYRQRPSLHTPPTAGNIVLTRQQHLLDFKNYNLLFIQHGIALIQLKS
ncbi:MAG: glycosyltransferase family 39 protein [Gammaproteobacteria bacterium]|nr:MAG: glycosyltransferase family 39 protein [Gammaproteobacteria bacterium]